MNTVFQHAQKLAFASLATVTLATGALAQDAGEAAPTETPAETAENTGPQIGQSYVAETFGDWEFRCIKTPEGQVEPCSIYQLLKDETGNDVAEVTIFTLEQEGVEAAMTFVTPLETLLTAQLSFFVDTENGRRYPFVFCDPIGCTVRAGLTSDEVTALKKGNVAQVGIVPSKAPDKPVSLAMSLTGFTKAFEKVTESNQASRDAAKKAAEGAAAQ